MTFGDRVANWLETHWVNPAFSGWLLGALSIFFFAAATNTMAGWLYVISGVSFALLLLAAVLSERSLRQIQVTRQPIQPVSSGDQLTIELAIENPTNQAKTLLQVKDMIPYVLGQPVQVVIESIPSQGSHQWVYYHPTQRRGVYRWETVELRTAVPLGLFWCRRSRLAKATATVYPTVLPLTQCPLIDEIGQEASLQVFSQQRSQAATEDLTRSLRPYRWGDPIRLVHWRTSARYGELRVRELEVFTGGQEVFICLDSAGKWQADNFEQAVIAAASLYFYGRHRQTNVKLWTAGTGFLQGDTQVLEALAATYAGEEARTDTPSPLKAFASNSAGNTSPLIWLSQNPISVDSLPSGSRWLLWLPVPNAIESSGSGAENQSKVMNHEATQFPRSGNRSGLMIYPDQPLQSQLQMPLTQLS
jgi:uncharacterized protein (DUF58 family)